MQASSEQFQQYVSKTFRDFVETSSSYLSPRDDITCNDSFPLFKALFDKPDLFSQILSWLWLKDISRLERVNKQLRKWVDNEKSIYSNILVRGMSMAGRCLTPAGVSNLSSKSAKLMLRGMTSAPIHVDYRSVFRSKKFSLGKSEHGGYEKISYRGDLGSNHVVYANDHFPLLPMNQKAIRMPKFTNCVVTADGQCLPYLSYVAYYEVEIDAQTSPSFAVQQRRQSRLHSNEEDISPCITIGIATLGFPLTDIMPGWDTASYGYHGDDGRFFHGHSNRGRRMNEENGPATFGPGDIVGCGIVYPPLVQSWLLHPIVFFTRNGELMGEFRILNPLQLPFFPVVGCDCYNPFKFNFNTNANRCRPFAFDVVEYERRKLQMLLDEDSHVPTSGDISQYYVFDDPYARILTPSASNAISKEIGGESLPELISLDGGVNNSTCPQESPDIAVVGSMSISEPAIERARDGPGGSDFNAVLAMNAITAHFMATGSFVLAMRQDVILDDADDEDEDDVSEDDDRENEAVSDERSESETADESLDDNSNSYSSEAMSRDRVYSPLSRKNLRKVRDHGGKLFLRIGQLHPVLCHSGFNCRGNNFSFLEISELLNLDGLAVDAGGEITSPVYAPTVQCLSLMTQMVKKFRSYFGSMMDHFRPGNDESSGSEEGSEESWMFDSDEDSHTVDSEEFAREVMARNIYDSEYDSDYSDGSWSTVNSSEEEEDDDDDRSEREREGNDSDSDYQGIGGFDPNYVGETISNSIVAAMSTSQQSINSVPSTLAVLDNQIEDYSDQDNDLDDSQNSKRRKV